jgi:hypothetical protein
MPKVEAIDAPETVASLLTIVEVDKHDRVQCQAEGCGHSVYKRIHIVLAGLKFKVLGSQCYQKLYGHIGTAAATPQYGSGTGRLLTAAERLVLVENTAKFIEALEVEHLAALEFAMLRQQQDNERAATQLQLQTHQATRQLQKPQHIPDDARFLLYEGAEMLRWRWTNAEVHAESIADYKVNPSPSPHHAIVMKFFQIATQSTPYDFALYVELRKFLPKCYIFRALEKLFLIERI